MSTLARSRLLAAAVCVFVSLGLRTSAGAEGFDNEYRCSSSQLATANEARKAAHQAISTVLANLDSGSPRVAAELERWFGPTPSAATSVAGVLGRSRDWLGNVEFLCLVANRGESLERVDHRRRHEVGHLIHPDWEENDAWLLSHGLIEFQDSSEDLFAGVDPSDLQTRVLLGLAFWDAPTQSFNSKLGTVIHEMTHFLQTGSTGDEEYGVEACLQLAKTDPSAALRNADSLMFFVESLLDFAPLDSLAGTWLRSDSAQGRYKIAFDQESTQAAFFSPSGNFSRFPSGQLKFRNVAASGPLIWTGEGKTFTVKNGLETTSWHPAELKLSPDGSMFSYVGPTGQVAEYRREGGSRAP